jgi:outer membrane protein
VKKLNILIIICVLLAASAVKCSADGISLESCFRAALKQSEVLADDQELVRQSEEHFRQAFASMLPGISAGYTYFNEDTSNLVPKTTDPSLYKDQATTKLSISQPLFRGFRDFAALKLNQNLIISQKLSYQWAAYQLYQDTANAFYLVLSLENDITILRKEANLYDKRITELRSRAAIGRSRSTEVLTVQVSRATLMAQLEQVKSQLSTARELLSFLTGISPSAELSDPDKIPSSISSFESYDAKLPARPDIKAATARMEAAQNNVDIAGGAYLPSADISADYYLSRPKGTLQNSEWDATITATLPIFTGGLNTSRHAEAESLLRQSRNDLEQVKRLASQDLRTTYQRLTYDISQVKEFTNAVDLARRNYIAVSNDYDLGLVANLDVLQAVTSYQDVERSLNRSVYALKADMISLMAITASVNVPDRTEAQ